MSNPNGGGAGSAGAAGQYETGGAGGSGTTGGAGGLIDYSLEAETREIMRVMGGEQPHDSEWGFMFPPIVEGQGGSGGSCRGEMADKMMAAHRVAIWLSNRSG